MRILLPAGAVLLTSVLGVSLAAQGGAQQPPPIAVAWNDAIPPGTPDHVARALKESSRHGEWVDIKMGDGSPLKTWVVYPERPDTAGVVLVIHAIGGLNDWTRALGDQLAQDGFIAIVPDFLSGPEGMSTESLGNQVGQAIRALTNDQVAAKLNTAMAYGRTLPASNGRTGVIGFCWGGARSFAYAAAQPDLHAAVVYYGEAPGSSATPPTDVEIAKIKAPVLGLYGGNDARINQTVPWTAETMKRLGRSYETHTYDGAGHGFLGNQAGASGANLKAAEQAWPITVAFLKKHLNAR